ncbi:putative apoptosis inhibitor [Ixodes scapularis]
MAFSYRSLPLTPIGYVLFQPTHLIPWGDERSKLTTGSAARHSTLAPSQKQQEQDQRKELHNLQQQQQHGQDWDHEGTSPHQDDSTGSNGQVKGDGDAPLPGNATASVGVEGPDVLLEEQDEVVALLVQVNERHEKQLAFERVLQERDGFWRKRRVTLGTSSSDSIDVIVDASLWRSVSDKVAYNSEKSPSPVPTSQLKQAEEDSIQLSSNSRTSDKSVAVSPEACVSNVLEQAETHNVEPSQRPDEEKVAPPQIVEKEDCHKLVESQIESQGSSHEVKLPKREYSYKPSSYPYREYHSSKRYSERNSQSSGSSNIRFNNQVTNCTLKNQMNSQKNIHVSDRSKSRYICQSNSHKGQQNDLKQQYESEYRESYDQENDQTLDKQPNNRPIGKLQTQSHGHPGNQSNCQARNKSGRQFNSQSSYHPNNQNRGRSNHYPSSQYNNQYKDRPDNRRDGHPSNQLACQSSTYLNTKNANRHNSQSDNQPRCQSNRSNDSSEKNAQEHLHRTPRSSLPYCCQNVNERACSPADSSPTPRGHQKQKPPPPPPPRPYSAPRPLQSDQSNKNHEKSTTSQQSEAQRPKRKDRRRNGASSDGSRKSAVSQSGGTVPLQQERTQAVACRKPIPLKMFWESSDMTIFRKRTS